MNTPKRAIRIALYLVFLLALCEGVARLAFAIPPVSKRLWADETLSWRRSWVSRHRATGMPGSYAFDIFDPTKGWVSKPGLRDMKVFGDKVLNTNSRGLRGKTEYPYSKDHDRPRILVLGDSFTFGDEVSDNETYSYYLQEMMPYAEVINMGVHAYGHGQMLILLKEEGVRYEPDIVIIGFLPFDMSRNLLKFRDYAKPRYVLDGGELRLTGTPVPTPEQTLKWDWARPRLIDLASLARHRAKQSSGAYAREQQEITTALLSEMVDVIKGIGASPIFVYLPPGWEISVASELTSGEEYLFSACRRIDSARCFSTRPRFAEKMAAGVVFKRRGHWRPAGHLTVAEAIKRYLIEEAHISPPAEPEESTTREQAQ